MADTYHIPVMADEVLDALDLAPGKVIVDGTIGGGGHSALISKAIGPKGTLIGIDQDSDAIAEATRTLNMVESGASVHIALSRFDKMADVVKSFGFESVDGVLLDLGLSSHQLDEASRGFTFRDTDAPLDMRMSRYERGVTAADLLNSMDEAELTRIFRDYADERWASRIAQFIVKRRGDEPYKISGQLVETINAAVPAKARAADTINPATRVYQALRIAVNDEYAVLESALKSAESVLASGGRMVVISFHSGEDRIVKRFMALKSGKGQCICPPRQPICTCQASVEPTMDLVAKKPLIPSSEEILKNARARSAKLRVAMKR